MTESIAGGQLTLTIPEAAKALRIGLTPAYQAAKSGELPTVRIGRRILVPRAALDRLLRGNLPSDRVHPGGASAV
jgi:excisionase family DNA binding protein